MEERNINKKLHYIYKHYIVYTTWN